MKTYFKTEKGINNAVIACQQNGMIAEKNILKCACGETSGYNVYDTTGKKISSLFLCNACYDSSPYAERGE